MTWNVWVRLGLLGLLAGALLALAYWILTRIRLTPLQRERRRREMVNRIGRTHDGFLTDVTPGLLAYQYSVNGVDYSTSQDVHDLTDRIPEDPSNLIGHVNIKYAPRNPANSILLCENWSGLRTSHQYRQAYQAQRLPRTAPDDTIRS